MRAAVPVAVNVIVASFGPFGTPELVILAILVLVLFGAKKLPTFGRSLGKSMGEFRKAKEEFERELHRSAERPKQENKLTPLDAAVFVVLIIGAGTLLVVALCRMFGW